MTHAASVEVYIGWSVAKDGRGDGGGAEAVSGCGCGGAGDGGGDTRGGGGGDGDGDGGGGTSDGGIVGGLRTCSTRAWPRQAARSGEMGAHCPPPCSEPKKVHSCTAPSSAS